MSLFSHLISIPHEHRIFNITLHDLYHPVTFVPENAAESGFQLVYPQNSRA